MCTWRRRVSWFFSCTTFSGCSDIFLRLPSCLQHQSWLSCGGGAPGSRLRRLGWSLGSRGLALDTWISFEPNTARPVFRDHEKRVGKSSNTGHPMLGNKLEDTEWRKRKYKPCKPCWIISFKAYGRQHKHNLQWAEEKSRWRLILDLGTLW